MSDPVELTEAVLRAMPLPSPDAAGDKEGRGRVLVVGGSREVPGGAVLAAISALRAGAGKLQLATAAGAAPGCAMSLPEARVVALAETANGEIDFGAAGAIAALVDAADGLLVGPGMMDEDGAARLLVEIVAMQPKAGLVADAASLCGLDACRPRLLKREAGLVLTPHAGEMAHLLGRPKADIEADPLAAAREASARYKAVVALKGKETLIVSPDGRAWLNRAGHVGLATSGSGDTLAGLIAGLLARGAAPAAAVLWGVFVHARAGADLATDYGGTGFLARELPPRFSRVLNALSG